jgi:hypothetical protein
MQPIDFEQEKKEILNKYKSLLRACADKTNKEDKKEIRKAFNLAVEAPTDIDSGSASGIFTGSGVTPIISMIKTELDPPTQ